MTKYTSQHLRDDLAKLNKQLDKGKAECRLVMEGRNGYTAIDLTTPEQLSKHTTYMNLVCGTPRECLRVAYNYVSLQINPE